MIEFKNGDILKENAEALVNTVNCVGVMGRGIALQFKNTFPDNFKEYAIACKKKEVQPGKMLVHTTGRTHNHKYIINFPTKRHWRGKSRMEDIESGLKALVETVHEHNISSIAIPPLGSGLGGLDWKEVRLHIVAAMEQLKDVRVVVFEPGGAPSSETMTHTKEVPTMTPGRAALVGLVERYLGGLLDPFVTLLEVHKLMYFMQNAGEPLRLHYTKAPYGPYADNLRHVLHAVEGYFISGYADGGDAPDKQLSLVPGALEEASAVLREHPETLVRFEKVTQLVGGFESPFGLELLATVHWVATKEHVCSQKEIIESVYAWGHRKKQFTPRQISIAADILMKNGWITDLPSTGKV